MILHKTKQINADAVDYIIKNRLYFIPKNTTREKILKKLGTDLKAISYYSPQISFLLCHLYMSHIIGNEYYLEYDSPIVIPAILDATYHHAGIVTISENINSQISIRGTKITPNFNICGSVLIFTKYNREFAIVLADKNLLPRSAYSIQMPSLATDLTWIVFQEHKINKSTLVPLNKKDLIDLLDLYARLLKHHMLGIIDRLYEETHHWIENQQYINMQQKLKNTRYYNIEQVGNLFTLLIRSFCLDAINNSSIISLYLNALIESLSFASAIVKTKNNIENS